MDRTVDAHPLTVDFAEGDGQNAGVPGSQSTRGSGPGVTWNCAADAEIANQATDCDPRWDGGAFGPATADPVLHVNGLSGEVRWDVTADVQAGVSAWLIKKTDERQAGRVSYFSREGAASTADPDLAPRLILETEPTPLLCGGDTSKCVFVASTRHNGNLLGLAGADQICQSLAESAGSLAAPGTYKAWLSTAAAPAESRLTHATVPYKLVNGTQVAASWADLTDGSIAAPVVLTEAGTQSCDPASEACPFWSATTASGAYLPDAPTCGFWAPGPSDPFGHVGEATTLASLATTDCNQALRLLCLQQ
jgi:hypothetical protein